MKANHPDGSVFVKRYPKGQKLLIGDDCHAWCRHCRQVVSKFDYTLADAAACLEHHVRNCHTLSVPSIQSIETGERTTMTSPVNAVTNESGRYYIHPLSNEKFWSVSTICKALAKPFLIPWAAKMAAQYAVEQWDYLGTLKPGDRVQAIKSRQALINRRASARGTQVHDGIEKFIAAGAPLDFDFKGVAATDDLAKWNDEQPEWKIRYAEIEPYYAGFVLWHRRFQPRYIHSETTVWNRTEHYAGTLDIIAELPHFTLPGRDEPGCTAIFDAKSGSGIYPEVGLQLAAYARGEFYLDGEKGETPLPHIDAAFALHVTDSGTKMIPVNIEDPVYRSFLYIREAFRFEQVISKTVLGPEVATAPGEGA